MSQPLVSVIIPLYNRKNLISRCVKSVCNQTYPNLEIIVVDDGSTDEPDEVLAELSKDERVKILRKPNGGVSSARNMGLDSATGDFVMFLDSDDAMMPTAAEWCVHTMEKEQADCVTFSFYHDGPTKTPTLPSSYKATVYRGDDCVTASFREWRHCSSCNKMYRRSLIGDLRVSLGISWGEDFIFSLSYLSKCQTLCALNVRLINVTPDSPGSLNKRYSPQGFHDATAQYAAIRDYLETHTGKEISELANRYLWGCFRECVRKLCLHAPYSYRQKVEELKQWSQSELFKALKPEYCPDGLACKLIKAQWYTLIPLTLQLGAWKSRLRKK